MEAGLIAASNTVPEAVATSGPEGSLWQPGSGLSGPEGGLEGP